MSAEKIRICDITLCQGENSPQLSFRETIELCRLLDKLDIDCIALNGISQKKIDSLLIKSICQAVKNTSVAVPVSIRQDDADTVIDSLKEARSYRLQVVAPVSSVQMEYLYHMKPAALQEKVARTIQKCTGYTKDVEFIAVDATRSDGSFLRGIISEAIRSGATTITLCDTAGSMLPEETSDFINDLRKDIPELTQVVLGYSCSDGLNLADACGIAAVQCGVREIKASSYRKDSISLRNIVNILNIKSSCFNTSLKPGVEKIGTLTGQIGKICRTGLEHFFHGDRPDEHEESSITLNAHESRDSICKAISQMGYDLVEEDIEKVWQRFTAISMKKGSISLKELEAIVATEALQVPPAYSDIQYMINTGSSVGAMAHMKLKFHGKPIEGIASGDGAIDAAFKSIEKATERHFELDDFQIQSVTEGREAMGETLIRLRSDGKLYSGKGISTDIVGAGIMAYVNALNKIVYEEGEA